MYSLLVEKLGRWDADENYIEPDIDTAKAWAVDVVNDIAGQRRREHFTDITAQDSVYLDKEVEARRCLADAAPTAEGYPYTDIERGIIEAALGQPCDLHTAAGFIVQVADEKRALSVAIEAQRRRAGEQVKAAQGVAEIEAILVAFMTAEAPALIAVSGLIPVS